MSDGQIAHELGITPQAVADWRFWHGLKSNRAIRKNAWTKSSLHILQRKYGTAQLDELATHLGRSRTALWRQAHKMGMQRTRPSDTRWANLNPTANLAYFVGAVLGDGGIYFVQGHHQICFTNTRTEIFESVVTAARIIIGHVHTYQETDYRKRHNRAKPVWRMKFSSKNLYLFMKDWAEIARLADRFPAAFLRGIYEAEGSLYRTPRGSVQLDIYNTNPRIIRQIETACGLLKIPVHTYRRARFVGHRPEMRVRVAGGESNVRRFLRLTKPCAKQVIP